MSEKRFRVHDLVKYDYSDIGEYLDENHTDRPLRNDEVCRLLNNYDRLEKWVESLENSNLLTNGDTYHYDRWIKQIKKYVEKTNKGFEYNEEFIIKLCLSYTLQSLRNGEDLKRFRWDMVNDE